ncbi:photosystem I assembly BtpA [Vulcanisaeta moutnovskia 768-28]|uniref:Photosystem I assembly BtpA n=1 Tax=Vulcanisaeta moutnovskia (strain 768-28) TaxID=985053 RepID=F0QV40_VULM7|nr:photosystem I assembly BtpA [Vulcanisaeta moutnovskia 768-28]
MPPLPGSIRYGGLDISTIIDFAVRNARVLDEAGFDAIILENFNDYPFRVRVKETETIASMAIIAREVVRTMTIPVGINLLRNSGPEAVAIAAVTGVSFIRSNAYCESIVSAEGIIEPVSREVLEVMTRLNTKVTVLADIFVKHASPLHRMTVEDVAKDCVERALADALVVTGPRTGEPPDPLLLRRVIKSVNTKVLVGSGINPNNINDYREAHGFIVGTYLKDEEGQIDLAKARNIVNAVKALARP